MPPGRDGALIRSAGLRCKGRQNISWSLPLRTRHTEAMRATISEPRKGLELVRGTHRGRQLAGTFGVLVLAKGHSPRRLQVQQGILRRDIGHRERRCRTQFGHTDYPQHPLCQILVLPPHLPELDIPLRLNRGFASLQTLPAEEGTQNHGRRGATVTAGHAMGQHMLALPQGMFHKWPQRLELALTVASRR